MVSVALDTNIVIAIFDEEPAVLRHLDLTPEVFLPSIVIGELCHGAFNSDNPDQNLRRIDTFATDCEVIDCDIDAAREYGRIKSKLRSIGKMIPENDIWIAACSLRNNLVWCNMHLPTVQVMAIVRCINFYFDEVDILHASDSLQDWYVFG